MLPDYEVPFEVCAFTECIANS